MMTEGTAGDRRRPPVNPKDAIGWSRTVPPLAVRIDLREDGWGLMRVLAGALEFADEDVSEMARGDVEHAEQDLVSGPGAEVERVGALCDFMAVAQARIDALAVQEGAAVLDLAA
jgi:hypothetical protein